MASKNATDFFASSVVDAHDVDDGIRACERFGESAAGEQVDAARCA